MRKTLLLAAAVVAAAALARAGRTAWAAEDLPDAAEVLPGVAVEQLTAPQRDVLVRVAREEFCYCGCPHTLSQCLRTHKQCRHAPRMAELASRLAGAGRQAGEILKLLQEYYASFEKPRRARLDTARFGPALGDEKAPVTIVEFSDFACPYCQVLKPVLDEFVRARPSRVRLIYKPFPLPQHPRSLEAAIAAEWARGTGSFWRMIDALFAHPRRLSDEDLADRAREIGADPLALREALLSPELRARVEASKSEAVAAGLRGTPTLFLNGRRLVFTDLTAAMLEFTLEDEEEWTRSGGWAKD